METRQLCDRLMREEAAIREANQAAADDIQVAMYKLEKMQMAIDDFCDKMDWSADTWKAQDWVAPLFSLRSGGNG